MRVIHFLLRCFLRLFYTHLDGANPLHILGTVFVTQKILRFNGGARWPVHHTSRVLYRRRLQLGRRTFPGWNSCCYIQARNGIILGNNVVIASGVGLVSANHDVDDYEKWSPAPPIRIGDNVWIGMHAIVTPGVTIGDNVVIGANSVVTSDIPSNSIAVGSPARVIKEKGPYRGRSYGTTP